MKTIFCSHRVNTIEALSQLPAHYGVEIDLRDSGRDTILCHDPYSTGNHVRFEEYLPHLKGRFVIANIKSEGVEIVARRLLAAAGIQNYFFLDVSFPALVKLSTQGERRIAARYSKFEPMEYVRKLQGMVEWVWADYLGNEGVSGKVLAELQSLGFKVALVSPELVGHPLTEIDAYAKSLGHVKPDLVCTKAPQNWEGLLGS